MLSLLNFVPPFTTNNIRTYLGSVYFKKTSRGEDMLDNIEVFISPVYITDVFDVYDGSADHSGRPMA